MSSKLYNLRHRKLSFYLGTKFQSISWSTLRLTASSYISKWIFRDFIFQIIFSSSDGCCTESLNSKKLLTNFGQKLINKQTGNPTFFSPKLICQFVRIYVNYFRFFSNLRNFLFSFEKPIKSRNLDGFAKSLRTTLKKFLNNRSEGFANMTQTFFDKRSFWKIMKTKLFWRFIFF